MKCPTTPKSLKIDRATRVGNVVIFVEGEKDEYALLEHILCQILNYKLVAKSRKSDTFNDFSEYASKTHAGSVFYVLNTHGSNISSIREFERYRDRAYVSLVEEYGVDIKNMPVYYLWDRDPESNPYKDTKDVVSMLNSAYDNEDYEPGLLLLSYPKLEAFILSAFETPSVYKQSDDLKDHISYRANPNSLFTKSGPKYRLRDIDERLLKMAVCHMHECLISLGIREYNLDRFRDTNIKILKREESIFNTQNGYRILSLLAILLIDLGIISEA